MFLDRLYLVFFCVLTGFDIRSTSDSRSAKNGKLFVSPWRILVRPFLRADRRSYRSDTLPSVRLLPSRGISPKKKLQRRGRGRSAPKTKRENGSFKKRNTPDSLTAILSDGRNALVVTTAAPNESAKKQKQKQKRLEKLQSQSPQSRRAGSHVGHGEPVRLTGLLTGFQATWPHVDHAGTEMEPFSSATPSEPNGIAFFLQTKNRTRVSSNAFGFSFTTVTKNRRNHRGRFSYLQVVQLVTWLTDSVGLRW